MPEYPETLVNLGQTPRRPFVKSNFLDCITRKLKITGKYDEKSTRSSDSGSSDGTIVTLEILKAEIEADLSAFGVNSAYDRKSKVINRALNDMGMGKYQWQLFTLCGMGWMADNLWLQGVAITLPQLSAEFGVSETNVRFTTLALFVGLCLGASFWGIAADVIGRRPAFNFTLAIAGIFGLAAGGAPNWIGVCGLFACVGLGIGGNFPVDGALFLEFLPHDSSGLLTALSAWWPVGQFISSILAWAFIPNYPVKWGWRYTVLSLGAITFAMFVCRFFFFHLFESPKFLLSRGRQTEAVAVIRGIAHHNETQTWLTEEILNAIGGDPEVVGAQALNTSEIVKRNLSKFSTKRIGPLFHGWRLTTTTCLLWFIWATIGMGYPLFNAFLPQYLANAGGEQENSVNNIYRDYAITSAVGIPGSLCALYTVNWRYIGRKGTMAISTVIAGIFIFLFTVSSNNKFQLAFTSLEAFWQNIMYGVLYAYTPEVFPAPNRGTGTGISSFLNRVAGLCAPLVAIYAGEANPKAPIYASGGLMLAAFVAMLCLPIETRGRHAL
ncbi:sugar transporter [Pseudovirgaria hyperparasitica]|uniref:Sugar transporter n=1 Tax=Pseudovirgaria hyperparasitica TaxID=470096 RepID=A0A6A6W9D3_9PEZI|nr:sugar transporter [Pseudovirgaria hyperparasitica]KAF2758550.1 sugar transporter [Pseudovirgaria hyperparasitica]